MNPTKFLNLTIQVEGHTKKFAVDSRPLLKIGGVDVPALSINQCYKYLGLQVNAAGTRAQVKQKMTDQIDQISRAPLKPQQRLWLLKTNMIPATLHQLVLAKTMTGYLRGLDIQCRKAVWSWVNLPRDVPVSYFYADVRDGRLGFCCFQYNLPEMISTRLVKLQCSEDPVVAKMAISEHYTSQLLKWSAPIYHEGNTMNSGKELQRLGWSQMLTSKLIDRRGLRDTGYGS